MDWWGKKHLIVSFFSYAGIKNYSNWPTIPQVYLNGEFVGGCDILLQMHQNGDLVEELKKLGIRSALLDAEKDQDKK
nr:PREDICTED: glutaredoxin-related protein 5, mitochondrial [Struthio camelus australis]